MPDMNIAEKPIYDALLAKVYNGKKEELEDAIAHVQEETRSINRRSAIRKLFRDKGNREIDSNASVSGYFLQQYQLAPGQDGESRYSVYLATPKGIRTVHIDDPRVDLPSVKESGLTMKVFGEPQTWTGLVEFENVLYGTKSLRVKKGATKFSTPDEGVISRSLQDLSKPVTQITDAQDLWHAYISVVFPVGEWEEGETQPSGNKNILPGGGAANARIGLTDEIDRKTGNPGATRTFVQITSEAQLRVLLGEYWDDTLLMSDNAFTELRDALRSQSVLVFGSGLTPNNPRLTQQQRERMKAPKIQLTFGRGLIVPYDWT